jgi:hypothetical protein
VRAIVAPPFSNHDALCDVDRDQIEVIPQNRASRPLDADAISVVQNVAVADADRGRDRMIVADLVKPAEKAEHAAL